MSVFVWCVTVSLEIHVDSSGALIPACSVSWLACYTLENVKFHWGPQALAQLWLWHEIFATDDVGHVLQCAHSRAARGLRRNERVEQLEEPEFENQTLFSKTGPSQVTTPWWLRHKLPCKRDVPRPFIQASLFSLSLCVQKMLDKLKKTFHSNKIHIHQRTKGLKRK